MVDDYRRSIRRRRSAARPLPQLPITVDADGYLVARSDFHEPVGPTYSQRGTHVEEMQGEAN